MYGRSARAWIISAVIVVVAALFCTAPEAMATKTHVFVEEFGSAAKPEILNAVGIAEDQSTEDVLVVSRALGTPGTATISRFHADGTPAPFSALGTNKISGLTISPEERIGFAVDNSGGVTEGNTYLAQEGQGVVRIFSNSGEEIGTLTGGAGGPFGAGPCGVAVDGLGDLFVSTRVNSKLYEYEPGANPPVNGDGHEFNSPVNETCPIAVGSGSSEGQLFATFKNRLSNGELEEGVGAIDPSTGALEYTFGVSRNVGVAGLAVDPTTGHLYAWNQQRQTIVEFAPQGQAAPVVSEFSEPQLRGGDIVVDSASGRLYVSLAGGDTARTVKVYSAIVTIPNVVTGQASITGEATATLRGAVEPEGAAITECFFEYGLTTAFGQTAPCEDPDASEIGNGSSPVPVHADIAGLSAETRYHVRLVAENTDGQVGKGSDVPLKTPSKPAITSQWAAMVGFSSANLAASINPENAATTYQVEWGTGTAYGRVTPVQPVGEDAADHEVTAAIEGLAPGTTYHYRFTASNHLGSVKGPDRSFTTVRTPTASGPCPNDSFRAGPAAVLPDCRAFEMVSHAERDGGDVLPMININSANASLDQSAPGGDSITYSTYKAAGDAISAPYVSQYIANRAEGSGWQNSSLNPPYGTPLDPVPFLDVEFRAFSPDLCESWLVQAPNTVSLAPGAIKGYANLFKRNDCSTAPGYSALNPTNLALTQVSENFKPDLQGVSANGAVALFRVNGKLTEEGIEGQSQVYAASEGKLRLICVLPSGVHFGGSCSTGTYNQTQQGIRSALVHNAVSADGTRVYWTAEEMEPNVTSLFLRTNPTKAQSKLSGGKCTEPARACTIGVSETVGTGRARFWGASEDGSKALFEMRNEESLYEFSSASDESTLIASEVLGVLGASEDLSRFYLVSREALAGGATASEPNVYLDEPGGAGIRYVATLAPADVAGLGQGQTPSPVEIEPTLHTAQVTPDGRQLTFMSSGSLTGYDNVDQRTGQADAEVFLYDATSEGGAGKLVCASCNPTGARAEGGFMEYRIQPKALPVAAFISPAESQLYAPRVLSDGGRRLFFTSTETLVPADTDAANDVYEWEAPGVGSCTSESGTYSPQNGGCLNLISSGQSASGATFIDSDEQGKNVFFTTEASLVREDTGLIDLYDARVEGGLAEQQVHGECEGESCQAPGGQPSTGSIGSSVTRGSENVIAKPKPKCPKGKKPARRKGKSVCVKKPPPKSKHEQHKKHDQHKKTDGSHKKSAHKHGGGKGR
jgi:hypothetical protein